MRQRLPFSSSAFLAGLALGTVGLLVWLFAAPASTQHAYRLEGATAVATMTIVSADLLFGSLRRRRDTLMASRARDLAGRNHGVVPLGELLGPTVAPSPIFRPARRRRDAKATGPARLDELVPRGRDTV